MSVLMPEVAKCDACQAEFVPTQRYRDDMPKRFFCSRQCQTIGQSRAGGSNYKEGFYVDKRGYVYRLVDDDRYALEHRLIAARVLGRPLVSRVEHVIHLDEDFSNNAPENLFIFATRSAMMKARMKGNYPRVSNLSPLTYEQAKP